jgi:hypothetical protein
MTRLFACALLALTGSATALADTLMPLPDFNIDIDPAKALAGLNTEATPSIEPVLLGEFSMGNAQGRLEKFYHPVTKDQSYVNITAYSEDLNNDGKREYIVMIATPKTCNEFGCQVDVLNDVDGKTFRVLYSGVAQQVLMARDEPLGKRANLILDRNLTQEENGKTVHTYQIQYVRSSDGSYTQSQ